MEATRKNTIVLIPSYNESKAIGYVIQSLKKFGLKALVVDDGSTDNTARIAAEAGAKVIGHSYNKGKGASIRYGFEYVLNETDFEWIVIMDGDGQHHAEDVPVFMKRTIAGNIDLVVGNRMEDTEDMPRIRYWTNRFTSRVVSGICKQRIPDTQCGFRLIKVNALKKLVLETDKYDIESEILIQAAELGMKIKSVPVRTIYGEEVSAISPFRDTLKFFALIIKYHFRKNGSFSENLNE